MPGRTIYGDQKNEPAWYDAVVESIEKDTDDAGIERVRFQVQFPDYGHGALVRLGYLDTRNNDSNGESLLKGKKLKVAQSQQSQAAPDKFTYSRPKGYKETLALKMDHASDRLERERARHGEEPPPRDDRYRDKRRGDDDARPRSRRDDDRYARSRRDDYDRSRRDRRDATVAGPARGRPAAPRRRVRRAARAAAPALGRAVVGAAPPRPPAITTTTRRRGILDRGGYDA